MDSVQWSVLIVCGVAVLDMVALALNTRSAINAGIGSALSLLILIAAKLYFA